LRSLDIAKRCKRSFAVKSKIVTQEKVNITIKHSSGNENNITLSKFPECADCTYCSKQNLCSHIIWAYLYVCNMPESSPILQQRALSPEELKEVVTKVRTSSSSTCSSSEASTSGSSQQSTNTTETEWELQRYKASRGKRPQCRKCKKDITPGTLVIVAHGMWSPPHLNSKGEKFYIPSKFYFCLNTTCCKHTPVGSTIQPPDHISISDALHQEIQPEEYEVICNTELPFILS
jgi:hypothetical protein